MHKSTNPRPRVCRLDHWFHNQNTEYPDQRVVCDHCAQLTSTYLAGGQYGSDGEGPVDCSLNEDFCFDSSDMLLLNNLNLVEGTNYEPA